MACQSYNRPTGDQWKEERERVREGGRKRWREGEREPYKPPLIKKLNHFEIVTMDIKLRFVVIATLASIALGFKPDDDVINDSLNEAKLRPFEEAHQFCLNKPGKKRYLLNFESFSHTFSNYPLRRKLIIFNTRR